MVAFVKGIRTASDDAFGTVRRAIDRLVTRELVWPALSREGGDVGET